ncbi:MAG: C10 family peptidase [Nitrosarchaeum sp.]
MSVNYKIPIDEALLNLDEALRNIDQNYSSCEPQRLNKLKRSVKNVEPILRRKNGLSNSNITKVNSAAIDTLLYIVNFEDSLGFAILSADKRIPSTVLAVIDSGNVNSSFFTGNKETIDLNKFNLYNAEKDEYYVGSFGQVAPELIYDYAEGSIDGGGGTVSTVTVYDNWQIKEKVTPLLSTLWHQGAPFNNNCPLYGSKRAPAGCVAVAVAQIMVFHEFPKTLYCDGYFCEWSEMKKINSKTNVSYTGTYTTQNEVSHFLWNVGGWCNMTYTADWSFALPSSAKNCMSIYGYQNLELNTSLLDNSAYNETSVINMLKNNNPVFIAAISGVTDGHAWVLDGYVKRARTVRTVNSLNGSTLSSRTENETLIHCNWGWNGYCNGYYMSGIFNLNNGSTYRESYETNYSNNLNFTWEFNLIKYTNPNI